MFRRSVSYYDSGVDIDAGSSLVDAIKPLAQTTVRSGCMSDLGGFGALFDLREAGYKDPILVSGTDGVGTKLMVCDQCRYTIGGGCYSRMCAHYECFFTRLHHKFKLKLD